MSVCPPPLEIEVLPQRTPGALSSLEQVSAFLNAGNEPQNYLSFES